MTINNVIEPTTNKNMSKLLDQYEYDRPKRGQFRVAKIMQIDHDSILVDLGAKTDAVVPVRELKNTDEAILEDLSEGDMVPVYIMKSPGMMRKPTVSLQRGVEKQDWIQAKKLLENKEIVHLKIIGRNKGGLLVKFGNLEGFLPASLMPTVTRVSNRNITEKIKSNLVGERVYMSAIEVKPKAERLIFSCRANQEEIKQKRFKDIQPGDILRGIVVNLVDFGAFIDLFGVDGLLHISELSWIRTDHPSEILSIGDKIEVKILDVDQKNGRIGLSRKALINPVEAFEIKTQA